MDQGTQVGVVTAVGLVGKHREAHNRNNQSRVHRDCRLHLALHRHSLRLQCSLCTDQDRSVGRLAVEVAAMVAWVTEVVEAVVEEQTVR
eukprot:5925351-Prymnesium_polylepis.4